MKEITKMSRLTGCLEKCFRLVNNEFFNDELPTPMITCVPTSRAYAHITVSPVWDTKHGSKYELNISAAYLNRPTEYIVSSLIHEATHLFNIVHNVQDTSNNGVYHNRQFKQAAEDHGLIVHRSEKYGWSTTEPGDRVLQFVLDHTDDLRDIEMNRSIPQYQMISIGTYSGNASTATPTTIARKSSYRRMYCPNCNAIVRSTRKVNIICGDCLVPFIEG